MILPAINSAGTPVILPSQYAASGNTKTPGLGSISCHGCNSLKGNTLATRFLQASISGVSSLNLYGSMPEFTAVDLFMAALPFGKAKAPLAYYQNGYWQVTSMPAGCSEGAYVDTWYNYPGASPGQYLNSPHVAAEFTLTTGIGAITAWSISNGGTGYYTSGGSGIPAYILLSGGSGSNATCAAKDNGSGGGIILTASINQGGVGYSVGDVLTIQGGGGNATLTVTQIDGGLPATGTPLDYSMVNLGTGYTVTSSGWVTCSGGSGTGLGVQISSIASSTGAVYALTLGGASTPTGYKVGDVITITGGGGSGTATFKITALQPTTSTPLTPYYYYPMFTLTSATFPHTGAGDKSGGSLSTWTAPSGVTSNTWQISLCMQFACSTTAVATVIWGSTTSITPNQWEHINAVQITLPFVAQQINFNPTNNGVMTPGPVSAVGLYTGQVTALGSGTVTGTAYTSFNGVITLGTIVTGIGFVPACSAWFSINGSNVITQIVMQTLGTSQTVGTVLTDIYGLIHIPVASVMSAAQTPDWTGSSVTISRLPKPAYCWDGPNAY